MSALSLRQVAFAGFVIAFVAPLHAQFNPGPNPITNAETGERDLHSGTGEITSSGSLSLDSSGGADLISLDGSGTILDNAGIITRSSGSGGSLAIILESGADGVSILNSGTIQNTGDGRAIRNESAAVGKVTINNSGIIQSSKDDAMKFADTQFELTNSGSILATGGQALDLIDIKTKALTITNTSTGIIQATDSDAIRPGAAAIINNAGIIRGIPVAGSSSDGIQGDANSGIQIFNSGTIQGRHAITGGIENNSPDTYAITVTNQAGGQINALNGSGVNIDGLTTNATATVNNAAGARILGTVDAVNANGDGDGVDVDGVVNLTNHGDVLGFGAKGVDSGGNPNNAEGVAAGGGTITNHRTGRIIGSTLASDAPNGDPSREGRGILIDDGNNGSGVAATNVTNDGLIWGKTGFAVKMVGNFNDTLTNNSGGIIRGQGSSATIQTGNGSDIVSNGGVIEHTGGGLSIAMEGGNDTLNINGGSASITGNADGGADNDTVNLNVGDKNSFSYDGDFTNFENLNANSGTSTLSGDSTISNSVTVADGAELNIDGSLSSSSIIVQDGGKLGGSGTISGPVTITEGATLAPGNSPGTIEFDQGLTLDPGSLLNLELSTLGLSGMIFVSGGTFDVEGGIINVFDIGVTEPDEYILIDYSGATLKGDIADLTLGLLPDGWTAVLVDDRDNSQIRLDVVATIPEPTGTSLLFAAGALALARRYKP